MTHQLLEQHRIPSNGSDETFDNMDDDNDMDEVDYEIHALNTRTRRRRLQKPLRSQHHQLVSDDEDPDELEEENEDEDEDEDEEEEERDGNVNDDDDFVMPESDAEEEMRDKEEGEEDDLLNEDTGSIHVSRQALRVLKNGAERPAHTLTGHQSDDDNDDNDDDDDDDDDDGDDDNDVEDDDDVPLSECVGRIRPATLAKQESLLQQKREPTLLRVKREEMPLSSGVDINSDTDDDIPIAKLGRRMRDVAKRKRAHLPRARAPRQTSSGTGVKRKQKKKGKSLREDSAQTRGVVKTRARRVKKEEEVQSGKFEKPGQRRETPPENDPLRLFYGSMYREKLKKGVKCVLAEDWMLKHGLLEEEEARRIVAEIGKRKRAT